MYCIYYSIAVYYCHQIRYLFINDIYKKRTKKNENNYYESICTLSLLWFRRYSGNLLIYHFYNNLLYFLFISTDCFKQALSREEEESMFSRCFSEYSSICSLYTNVGNEAINICSSSNSFHPTLADNILDSSYNSISLLQSLYAHLQSISTCINLVQLL